MTTWMTENEPDETCTQCGAVYKVTSTQYPARDKGRFICACGKELRSWNGTRDYTYQLKTIGYGGK